MSPEQIRAHNTLYGSILIPLGLFVWIGAVYMVFKPNSPIRAIEPKIEINKADCDAILKHQSFNNVRFDNSTKQYSVVSALDAVSPKSQFYAASLVVTECKGNLIEFCAGEGCQKSSFNFIFSVPTRDIPAASPSLVKKKEATSK